MEEMSCIDTNRSVPVGKVEVRKHASLILLFKHSKPLVWQWSMCSSCSITQECHCRILKVTLRVSFILEFNKKKKIKKIKSTVLLSGSECSLQS